LIGIHDDAIKANRTTVNSRGVPCRARFGVLIRAMAPSRESRYAD